MAEKRNPSWTRDELLIALDYYLEHSGDYFAPTSDGIIDLTSKVSRVAKALGLTGSDTLRNANGVSMKLMNFRAHDPSHNTKGLSRGNKLEEVVWKEFAGKPVALKRVVSTILSSIENDDLPETIFTNDDTSFEAPEGQILTRVHRVRERNSALVKRKKASHLKRHGHLSCEACDFNFSETYGDRGNGFIECHHTKPVSELVAGETTKLADLVLLCSNCHRMVHASRPWWTIEELRAALAANKG